MNAVISVDAYLFSPFSDLTCYRNRCFLVVLCHLTARRPNLEAANQESSPSAGKNTGVVLVLCSHMEVRPWSDFLWWVYFRGPWVSFAMTNEFSVRVTKFTSGCGLPWTHSLPFYFWPILTQWIMVILSKGCKPDNLEPHNSLKLSFMNIWDLCSSFIDCESFLESNSPHILALCEANLDDSIDSGNVSVKGYLPLIWKNSTNILGLAVYLKEGLPFAWDLSLENCADSFLLMFSTGFTSLSVLLLLPLSINFVIMHCFLFYFI